MINRQWRLAQRPKGMVTERDFTYHEEPAPAPADGELLVRTLYVSFDPAMRAFLTERASYAAPQPVGAVMRAGAVGQVVESLRSGFEPGDFLVGAFGWQDFTVIKPEAAIKITPRFPLPYYLSVLGGTGLTAYFGLLHLGRPKPGETVLVSGAAGATGSTVVQLSKLNKCRTIAIAGGKKKCQWLLEELGADAAIDYKSQSLDEQLGSICPKGVDIYFDNVGGQTLQTAIDHMAQHGRLVLCGMISEYNAEQPPPGPSNLFEMVTRRLRMEGFLVGDYAAQFGDARRELERWLASGELKAYADVQEGFENIPKTFLRIFTGQNIGKQLLKIADPPLGSAS